MSDDDKVVPLFGAECDCLPSGGTVLSKDQRAIDSIWLPAGPGYRVGDMAVTAAWAAQVTRIVAYDEYGQQAFVPWLAVFAGDQILVRIPADQVSVHYAKVST